VIGGGYTSVLGDCPDCTAEPNYRSAGSFLANIGVSLNSRADIGGELMWVPSTSVTGETIRTTYVMAVGPVSILEEQGILCERRRRHGLRPQLGGGSQRWRQYRPAIHIQGAQRRIGAGWEWRLRPRFGVQVFGSQHVAALGDLQANQAIIENVVGNFWTVGGAIVFR
jgi:hypothetical protein